MEKMSSAQEGRGLPLLTGAERLRALVPKGLLEATLPHHGAVVPALGRGAEPAVQGHASAVGAADRACLVASAQKGSGEGISSTALNLASEGLSELLL